MPEGVAARPFWRETIGWQDQATVAAIDLSLRVPSLQLQLQTLAVNHVCGLPSER